mgnify:CR=1 FL=1
MSESGIHEFSRRFVCLSDCQFAPHVCTWMSGRVSGSVLLCVGVDVGDGESEGQDGDEYVSDVM